MILIDMYIYIFFQKTRIIFKNLSTSFIQKWRNFINFAIDIVLKFPKSYTMRSNVT